MLDTSSMQSRKPLRKYLELEIGQWLAYYSKHKNIVRYTVHLQKQTNKKFTGSEDDRAEAACVLQGTFCQHGRNCLQERRLFFPECTCAHSQEQTSLHSKVCKATLSTLVRGQSMDISCEYSDTELSNRVMWRTPWLTDPCCWVHHSSILKKTS